MGGSEGSTEGGAARTGGIPRYAPDGGAAAVEDPVPGTTGPESGFGRSGAVGRGTDSSEGGATRRRRPEPAAWSGMVIPAQRLRALRVTVRAIRLRVRA